jgi:pimeloyl-ACP methyl ester carboxylesterase
MNDVGAFVPTDALRKIGRNLRAPERFATMRDVEDHLRDTHREWGELSVAQWRHIAFHGSRRVEDHYRLHYDPQIMRLVEPGVAFAPGLFFWDAWYKVKCPVLLVRGETSEVFPREVADTMLKVKTDARLVEIPGCGHAPSLMHPEHIAVVTKFLPPRSDKMPRAWRMPFPSSPSSRPAF